MKLTIKINKKRYVQYCIWIELFFVCFSGVLIDIVGLPRIIKYFPDVINIILMMYLVKRFTVVDKTQKNVNVITTFIFVFILLSFILWFVNRGSIPLLFWGARNTFRFLMFFIAIVQFWTMYDVEKMCKYINPLLIINFLFCIYEYFILGYSGDYIGGGFGISQGCNAPLNVLLVVVTVYNAVRFMQKKEKWGKTILYIALCSGISGMAELKVYVVEVVMVVLIVGAFSKGFIKKILLVLAGVAFAFASIHFIEILIPGWEGFFTIENMYKMVSSKNGYNNSGDLNRLTAITELNRMFFKNGINIIGLGLGNCEYSDTFSFLNSSFYRQYGFLHYAWFSVAKIYLELGWFGICSHFFIWGYTFWVSIKKVVSGDIKIMVAAIALFAGFFFFYNFTMNLESAYIIYSILAISYISLKEYTVEKS